MPNLIVEYESTNHLQPLFVKGTRCSARSSVGDNVVSPSLDIIFCTSGQMAELPAVGNKVTGLDVAIASLVLLSRIASNGAKGRSCETSGHDLRSVCIQCIACDGSCLSSTSRPRRTASEEKSTLYPKTKKISRRPKSHTRRKNLQRCHCPSSLSSQMHRGVSFPALIPRAPNGVLVVSCALPVWLQVWVWVGPPRTRGEHQAGLRLDSAIPRYPDRSRTSCPRRTGRHSRERRFVWSTMGPFSFSGEV